MNTEAQAKELWCPMVRHEADEGGSFNRGTKNDDPTNKRIHVPPAAREEYGCHCIASKCAMWRWGVGHEMPKFVKYILATEPVEPDGARKTHGLNEQWEWCGYDPENESYQSGWWEPQSDADKRRVGYCGIAGRPV